MESCNFSSEVPSYPVDHSPVMCSNTNPHEAAHNCACKEWHVNPPVGGEGREKEGRGGRAGKGRGREGRESRGGEEGRRKGGVTAGVNETLKVIPYFCQHNLSCKYNQHDPNTNTHTYIGSEHHLQKHMIRCCFCQKGVHSNTFNKTHRHITVL